MLLMKILGAILLCLTGTAIGTNALSRLKKRTDALEWYYKAAAQIGSRIGGTAAELYDIINTIYGKEHYLRLAKPFKIEFNNESLNREDLRTLSEFFGQLGSGGIEAEIKRCEMYSNILKDRYKKALEEYTQKSKLYKMLGLFSGLTVAIIIM